MPRNNKHVFAVFISALALGLGLLVIGKTAKAQDAKPTVDRLLAMSKLSTNHLNIDYQYVMERNDDLRKIAGERDKNKILFSPDAIRSERDASILALTQTNFKNEVSNNELAAIAKAVTNVLSVCAMGTSYIQHRLNNNNKAEFWYKVAANLYDEEHSTAVAASSSKSLNTKKLFTSNRSNILTTDGDLGYNNFDLTRVLAQIKQELVVGVNKYNKAILMSSNTKDEQLSRYRHLQAAVMGIHTACAVL